MLLASRWRERPPVLVVTVDHGLRPEAAEEARLVAENAERLESAVADHDRRPRRDAAICRTGRGARAIAASPQAAREAGFDTIVTAHHQDDQAETFLLQAGEGIGRLRARRHARGGAARRSRPRAAASRRSARGAATRSRRRAACATVTDPSNADLRFDRVRMRALMPTLAEHGLDASRLAETAGAARPRRGGARSLCRRIPEGAFRRRSVRRRERPGGGARRRSRRRSRCGRSRAS